MHHPRTTCVDGGLGTAYASGVLWTLQQRSPEPVAASPGTSGIGLLLGDEKGVSTARSRSGSSVPRITDCTQVECEASSWRGPPDPHLSTVLVRGPARSLSSSRASLGENSLPLTEEALPARGVDGSHCRWI
ncbi:unnamed protein product [Diplocarpon coronariae]